MADLCDEINIIDYTLKEFNPPKLAGPTVEVVFIKEKDNEENLLHGQLKCKDLIFPFAKDNCKPIAIPITKASVLVNLDQPMVAKETIEIAFDSANFPMQDLAPGDTIAILPHNDTVGVDFLLQAMKIADKDEEPCRIEIHPSNLKKNLRLPHIPQRTTPRELLRDVLNIRAIPKKQFLRNLAEQSMCEKERDFLNCLASKEGSKYYNTLFLKKCLSLCDLLKLCPSCQPSLSMLIEHLPRLLPRPYSIANSPSIHENELKIIYSILPKRAGVTTTMLTEAAKNFLEGNQSNTSQEVLIYPRQTNNFRYTLEVFENNQILIAIGTGVAPFLGFLEHKDYLMKTNKNLCPGKTWLFIGATTEKSIPHRSALIEFKERDILQKYFESLSRVSDAECHYVQEQLAANAKELIELFLKKETSIYVCADGADISQSIELSLTLCLQQELHLPLEEVKDMLKQFRNSGKYREDLWT